MKNPNGTSTDYRYENQPSIHGLEDQICRLFWDCENVREAIFKTSELLSRWFEIDDIDSFKYKLTEILNTFLLAHSRNSVQDKIIKMINIQLDELDSFLLAIKSSSMDRVVTSFDSIDAKEALENFSLNSEMLYKFVCDVILGRLDFSDEELLVKLKETIDIIDIVKEENSCDSPDKLEEYLQLLRCLDKAILFRKNYFDRSSVKLVEQERQLLEQTDAELAEDFWRKTNNAKDISDLEAYFQSQITVANRLIDLHESAELVQFTIKLRHLYLACRADFETFDRCRKFHKLLRNINVNSKLIFVELSAFLDDPLVIRYLNLADIVSVLEENIRNHDYMENFKPMLAEFKRLHARYRSLVN
jgi:hypothetical protein